MPAYWIARAAVKDPAQYQRYTDRVPAIVVAHGGRILARGGRFRILEGPADFHRFVVIEFDSFEAGIACFESAEYVAAASARRRGAGVVEISLVEGGDATP